MYASETIAKFRECLRSWILPQLGEREVASLTRIDILSFRRAMAGRNLSIARQYSLLVVLKLLLRFCRTTLKLDTLDPAEIKLPRRPYRRVEFLTPASEKGLPS